MELLHEKTKKLEKPHKDRNIPRNAQENIGYNVPNRFFSTQTKTARDSKHRKRGM
jgi:hypothetical protein